MPWTPTPAKELSIGRRENARAIIGAPGKLTLIKGTGDCVVADLSCTGARFCASETLKPGVEALIEIDDLELFGPVVWGKRGQFGMVFDQPLAVEKVIELRWQADQICQQEKDIVMARVRAWVEGRV